MISTLTAKEEKELRLKFNFMGENMNKTNCRCLTHQLSLCGMLVIVSANHATCSDSHSCHIAEINSLVVFSFIYVPTPLAMSLAGQILAHL